METTMNPAVTPASAQPPRSGDSSIGALLLASGKITPESAERVLRMQRELGIRFGEAAQRLGLITEGDIQQVLARQFDYPYLQPGEGGYSPHLSAAYQPFSPQVEALRALRSQLMVRWFARGNKSLAVVAVDQGDGASLFAANLAVVFSQLGERTVLVDANLRAPTQQQVFDIKPRQGLSDVLAGRVGLEVVAKVPSFVSLSVLTAGTLPPNPQELLSRSGFTTLARQLESQFDVVLYDTPAVTAGADALAISARSAGVVLVLRKNHTLVNAVDAVADKFRQAGAEVLGAIVVDF